MYIKQRTLYDDNKIKSQTGLRTAARAICCEISRKESNITIYKHSVEGSTARKVHRVI